jgi:hypothetical protein
MNTLPVALSAEDQRLLQWAHRRLEQPHWAIRMAQVVGAPLQATLRLLPNAMHSQLQRMAEFCIRRALAFAIADLEKTSTARSLPRHDKTAAILAGGVAGFFGGTLLWVELPFTTLLMLRSIADVARRLGEDLNSPETRLACVEVFALGGGAKTDYAADTGYYGLRLGLEWSKANALTALVESGLKGRGSPAAAEWIMGIARRFGMTLSEKAAVQFAPVVGAVGGATLNAVFIQHFREVARGHFTMRRLERKYGKDLVQRAYEQLGQPPG